MKPYELNILGGGINLITLLDYKTQTSQAIQNVPKAFQNVRTILIDAGLVAGLNEYRFIEVPVKKDGMLDIKNVVYVTPSKQTVNLANLIIRRLSSNEFDSILSESQLHELFEK